MYFIGNFVPVFARFGRCSIARAFFSSYLFIFFLFIFFFLRPSLREAVICSDLKVLSLSRDGDAINRNSHFCMELYSTI